MSYTFNYLLNITFLKYENTEFNAHNYWTITSSLLNEISFEKSFKRRFSVKKYRMTKLGGINNIVIIIIDFAFVLCLLKDDCARFYRVLKRNNFIENVWNTVIETTRCPCPRVFWLKITPTRQQMLFIVRRIHIAQPEYL